VTLTDCTDTGNSFNSYIIVIFSRTVNTSGLTLSNRRDGRHSTSRTNALEISNACG